MGQTPVLTWGDPRRVRNQGASRRGSAPMPRARPAARITPAFGWGASREITARRGTGSSVSRLTSRRNAAGVAPSHEARGRPSPCSETTIQSAPAWVHTASSRAICAGNHAPSEQTWTCQLDGSGPSVRLSRPGKAPGRRPRSAPDRIVRCLQMRDRWRLAIQVQAADNRSAVVRATIAPTCLRAHRIKNATATASRSDRRLQRRISAARPAEGTTRCMAHRRIRTPSGAHPEADSEAPTRDEATRQLTRGSPSRVSRPPRLGSWRSDRSQKA